MQMTLSKILNILSSGLTKDEALIYLELYGAANDGDVLIDHEGIRKKYKMSYSRLSYILKSLKEKNAIKRISRNHAEVLI